MNTTLKAKDLAIMGVMAAIAYLSQVVLSFLPNIELVTLLFILYTLVIGKKSFWCCICLCFSGRHHLRLWTMVDQLPLCMDSSLSDNAFISKTDLFCFLEYNIWSLRNGVRRSLQSSILFYQWSLRSFCLLDCGNSKRYYPFYRQCFYVPGIV